MKKLIVVLMAVVLLAGMSAIVHAVGITGSAHDFTDNMKGYKIAGEGTGVAFTETGAGGWNGRSEICRVCHVPHDHGQAAQRYTNGLLWNHGVSSSTYTMYDSTWSSTMEGVQSASPDGTAKLCLGCHDGSVGIDTFDKYAGGAILFDDTSYSAGYKVPGFADGANLDLRGTHPISVAFPAGQEGDGKNFTDSTTATWSDGSTIASTLDNGKVQCSTCHDVHGQEAVSGTHLLRAGQTIAQGGTASGLCLTCHVK